MFWMVFESWMVIEWNIRKFGDERLGIMFGIMMRVNCSVVVLGGLIGDLVVEVLGMRKGFFVVGVVSVWLLFVVKKVKLMMNIGY